MNGGNLGVSTGAPNFCRASTYCTDINFGMRSGSDGNEIFRTIIGGVGRIVNKLRIRIKIIFSFC